MAIAGRVAMIPKGDYDATVTYQILDIVRYNDASYVAKKSSTGMLPTDTEYWMLMTQDGLLVDDAFSETSTNPVQNKVVNEAIQNIVSGTTPAGDSEKLGGKGAMEYALVEEIKSNSLWNELTSGFDLNNALGRYRASSGTIVKSLLNLPPTITSGEVSVVWYPTDSANLYGVQELRYTHANGDLELWRRMRQNTVWGEWECLATTADLANYFPLTGGEVGQVICKTSGGTTPLKVYRTDTDNPFIEFLGKSGLLGHLGYNGVDNPVIRLASGYLKEILHSGNVGSYALPLTGGKISNTLYTPLNLENTAGDINTLGFNGASGVLGYLGFNAKNPVYKDTSNTYYHLLHSGNVGSYALPISGGTVGTGIATAPIVAKGNEVASLLQYDSANNEVWGFLGFQGANNLVAYMGNGATNYKVLHEGNYTDYTVYKGTSAPSSTTCIWVDTANKVIKAYIDGAWTQVS